MMVSRDSQEYLGPRDSLERWVHQACVTAAEAATELHSKQVGAQESKLVRLQISAQLY